MSSSIKHLIRLAERTGDRVILHDSAKDTTMVLLSLAEYEHLLESQHGGCGCHNNDCDMDEDRWEDDMDDMFDDEYEEDEYEEDFFPTQSEDIPFTEVSERATQEKVPHEYDWYGENTHMGEPHVEYPSRDQDSPDFFRRAEVPRHETISYKPYGQEQKSPSWEDDGDPVFLEEPIPF